MRKVTREICTAFEQGRKRKIGNSSTDGRVLWLHGNAIALREDGKLFIRHAGWKTRTTKERLNGLTGVSVVQRDFEFYCNGIPMRDDSDWHHVV